MKDGACHDYTVMLHVMKWSSFLISEWLDLLVSFCRVTILLELYRENWQGGYMHSYPLTKRRKDLGALVVPFLHINSIMYNINLLYLHKTRTERYWFFICAAPIFLTQHKSKVFSSWQKRLQIFFFISHLLKQKIDTLKKVLP